MLSENIAPDEDGFYSIHRDELLQRLGYLPNKNDLREDLSTLRQEPITINYLGKDGKPVTQGMGFISEWKLTSTRISFRLPSFIMNVLQGDVWAKEMFLLLNWDIFVSFTGKYEAILYKLCRDYLGVGRTPDMSIATFRGYIGVKDTEYSEFKKLNHNVIKKSVESINNSPISDICIEPVYFKKGLKVTGLYFKVQAKENNLVLPKDVLSATLSSDVLRYPFHESRISLTVEMQELYLNSLPQEEIVATIQRANQYADELASKGKAVRLGGIYRRAFSENWGKQKINTEAVKNQAIERKKQQEEEKIRKKIEVEEANKQAENELLERKQQLIVQFESLSEEKQNIILDAMEASMGDIQKTRFHKLRKEGCLIHKDPRFFYQLEEVMLSMIGKDV